MMAVTDMARVPTADMADPTERLAEPTACPVRSEILCCLFSLTTVGGTCLATCTVFLPVRFSITYALPRNEPTATVDGDVGNAGAPALPSPPASASAPAPAPAPVPAPAPAAGGCGGGVAGIIADTEVDAKDADAAVDAADAPDANGAADVTTTGAPSTDVTFTAPCTALGL